MLTSKVAKILPFVAPLTEGWKIRVLPGGKRPVRHGAAVAHDLYTRAIVDVHPDPKKPYMRKTLYNFRKFRKKFKENIRRIKGRWVWILYPGQSVRIGIGVVMELPLNQAGYVEPRGSSANRFLEVVNCHVPIDPDFRAEPSALLRNTGNEPIEIKKGESLVQLTRKLVNVDDPIDEPLEVFSLNDMSITSRGVGQNGSTNSRRRHR